MWQLNKSLSYESSAGVYSRNASVNILLLLSLTFLTGCPIGSPGLPNPAVRYIAFGDSTTRGPARTDYPEFLRQRLDVAPETFTNEGRSGETTSQGLDRLRGLLDQGIYPQAHTFLYWQGGNDLSDFIQSRDPLLLTSPRAAGFPFEDDFEATLEAIQNNLEEAIGLARAADMDVFIATYYPMKTDTPDCDALPFGILLDGQAANGNEYINQLNRHIRRAASNAGALLVDVARRGAFLVSNVNNYTNCNHLSAQGNQSVAEAFEIAITGAR